MTRRLYNILVHLALPFIFMRLLWRSRRNPAYRSRWRERLGYCDGVPSGAIWIHAVSVGESQAAEPLIRQLQLAFPDLPILMTTTTPTGADHVGKLYAAAVSHRYFPLDVPFAICRFLDQVRPRLMLMMETEIWPNLLAECASRGIPTLLANARLSAKSAKGYARLGAFTREVFGTIDQVAAQSEEDAKRFLALGVPAERLEVTGSLKFDVRLPASLFEQAEVVRRGFGHRPVWIAASTRDGEEDLILKAHRRILRVVPGALLLLVPRHPERFNSVAQLCKRQGFSTVRRSEGELCAPRTEIYLGDSMGELSLFLAASDAAFFGGSLVKLGGHNFLEAAAMGVPVSFGPHMFNFSAISRMFLEKGAAVEADSPEALASVMMRWLNNAGERSRVGERGRELVARNRGAREKLLALMTRMLR
ncbi:MAG: lipid IV(A) 3-deoxy-D-manno-octulosonic acid transferase [Gammaproteobacteria bacterium]|nr:lipid IV(A) 3-deoxy-D-manno-octulosonic acid transferase [Gammaproteobacteria bacterium]MBU1656272.1 lipid IV(A) 3-deoxy-D-manno-octulosonic acid transferase [Gammaproteobacteria bacterium]MBU1959837.1 lipid IV(A) 3-deoxy-D-manno-octulosonic acid transferase [Gammaproteobacteria bacterium]